MKLGRAFLATGAAALVGIQVGSALVATRFVISQIEPASLALLRYTIGLLCFLPALTTIEWKPFRRKDIVPIALLGTLQFAIVVALLNYSVLYISAARASLLFATLPLMTTVIAVLLGKESLNLFTSLGIILTIIGVGFILGEELHLDSGYQRRWGDLLVLGSVLAAAVCSIFYRTYLNRYPTTQVAAFAMLNSVLFLAVLAAGEGFFNQAPQITVSGWVAILFIGISSGVGYFLWLWALKNISATKVTSFLALSPLTASILGVLFLSEAITGRLFIAIIFIVSGLLVAVTYTGVKGKSRVTLVSE
ncbi:MAG: DMT family transporter [Chloroflexota bacterium]